MIDFYGAKKLRRQLGKPVRGDDDLKWKEDQAYRKAKAKEHVFPRKLYANHEQTTTMQVNEFEGESSPEPARVGFLPGGALGFEDNPNNDNLTSIISSSTDLDELLGQ